MNKEDFLKKLTTELKISKNSDYTIRNYLDANSKLLNFSNKSPEMMDQDDVKAFMASNLTKQSSASTIVFLSAIRYAYSNILQKDLTSNIKRPKRERKIPTVLTKEEIKALLAALSNKKSRLMVSMLYACGFRVSELVNLKIKDLNFEEKIGQVRQGKGKKDRIFNIPESLVKTLEKQIKLQQEQGQEYLFTGPKGPISTRTVESIVTNGAQKGRNQEKRASPYFKAQFCHPFIRKWN